MAAGLNFNRRRARDLKENCEGLVELLKKHDKLPNWGEERLIRLSDCSHLTNSVRFVISLRERPRKAQLSGCVFN